MCQLVEHFLAVTFGYVNIAAEQLSFLGLNICFDNKQFKLANLRSSYQCMCIQNNFYNNML